MKTQIELPRTLRQNRLLSNEKKTRIPMPLGLQRIGLYNRG